MSQVRTLLFGLLDGMSRAHKRLAILMLDALCAALALLCAVALVYTAVPALPFVQRMAWYFPLVITLAVASSYGLGLHRIQLKAYESSAILLTALGAALVTMGLALTLARLGPFFPVTGVVLFGLVYFVMVVAARTTLLHLLLWTLRQGQPRRRVLIYGAGNTGVQLAAALRTHPGIAPAAFIDDNSALQGSTAAGLRIYPPTSIPKLARRHEVERVILAMPSVPLHRLARIAQELAERGLSVMQVPSFSQLLGEEALVASLTPVEPGRFLNRTPVDTSLEAAAVAYAGRSVLVSGAGGSVGSELCRQLVALRPRRLVLFEVSEVALYTVERELAALAQGTGVEVVPVLGSATDSRMARMVMREHAIEVVVHAAAYKHVPLVEANPLAGLANNVLGTRTMCDAAEEAGVGRFVFVSTDKAVRPANVMGGSKRMAELVVQDMAKRAKACRFSIVRFGNVLGSSGSVVPLFREQIARGGPVTLTHEDVTRYFMTITEAVKLILIAGSFDGDPGAARGGGSSVYVLDMGQPVRIRHLAAQMIEAAGMRVRDADRPDGDIEIVVTGLRPGEKLHEEPLVGPGLLTTPHPKILRAEEDCLPELRIAAALRALRTAVAAGDAGAARSVLQDCVGDMGWPEEQRVASLP